MRLAILTLSFPPSIGGVQTYLFDIATRLGQKHEVLIITTEKGKLGKDLPFSRMHPKSNRATGFYRALRAFRPQRILVGHAHPQLLLAAYAYNPKGYAAMAYGNDYLAAQRRWHRPLFNWLLNNARPVIAITKAQAHRIQELGLQAPVVIYPGTDPDHFSPSTLPPTASTLLTISRLVPRKGIDITIRALQLLEKEHVGIKYIVGGTGSDLLRLKELVAELNLQDVVEFRGYIPDHELPSLYNQAQIFVMPAREVHETASVEGFGIVYLEASASGLPVIAGRSGGAIEAVREGETGLIVQPDDPAALAQAINRLLRDPELRQRMGAAGRRWVEQEMNWDRAANQMAQVLRLDN